MRKKRRITFVIFSWQKHLAPLLVVQERVRSIPSYRRIEIPLGNYNYNKCFSLFSHKPTFRTTIIAYRPSSSLRRNIHNGLWRLNAIRFVVLPMECAASSDGETAGGSSLQHRQLASTFPHFRGVLNYRPINHLCAVV